MGRGRYRKLAIHTVAAPALRVSVSAAHQRTRTFSRTLAPCRTYVYKLPHFTHARVGLAAAARVRAHAAGDAALLEEWRERDGFRHVGANCSPPH